MKIIGKSLSEIKSTTQNVLFETVHNSTVQPVYPGAHRYSQLLTIIILYGWLPYYFNLVSYKITQQFIKMQNNIKTNKI